MLSILVLLVASSALAAPGAVNIRQVSSNNLSYRDNSAVGGAFGVIDDGDLNINEVNIEAILGDLSSVGNQALANGQAVAVLGEVATGRPGDACAAANYVNAYTRYVSSGNSAGVREALRKYINVVSSNIDNIVRLATNKESVRFASGHRSGCAGEGRSYQFDSAWDIILGSAAPNQQSIINEEFCVAKRLYCALNAVSNNVGAQITASALPPTVQVFEQVGNALRSFVSRIGAKDNLGQPASALQQALASAVNRVSI